MNNKTLKICDLFYSLQGEGPKAGHPAVFIRLSGCNLQCSFCDTDHTSKAQDYSISSICNQVVKWSQTNLVVITGGEPFLQDFSGLCYELLKYDKHIQIETNGTYIPEWFTDLVTRVETDSCSIICSPKNMEVDMNIDLYAEAFKYVIRATDVYEASGLPRGLYNPLGSRNGWISPTDIYLQPMDEKNAVRNQANVQAAVASCLQYGYRLSLQQHKIVGCK